MNRLPADELSVLFDDAQILTGKKIAVEGKPDLRVHGKTIYPQQAGEPIRIQILSLEAPYSQYLIAHELMHIKRFFEAASSKRLRAATDQSQLRNAISTIIEEVYNKTGIVDAQKAVEFATTLIQGLVAQLVNTPVDIQIERYLFVEHPGLRDAQRLWLQKYLSICVGSVSATIEASVPQRIFVASNVMNAVYFRLLSKDLGFESISNYPYEDSRELVGLLADYTNAFYGSDQHASDMEMINYWAEHLGLAGWFSWIANDR